MLSIYTSYICCSCRKEFVLLSEEIESLKGYLVCPYCSSRKVKKENIADNLKECMSERSYKRIKGAIRQR
ncbi:TPA: hypothetical protein ACXDAZ_003524 [Clostridium botulinum]|uniref:hypothetical protein n=1 Tax=Clostridium botulinum TaxID=1491 RepID=UPI0008FC7EAB|nr:hypothetical protein [Clostridium botulinum]APC79920.1 hypothetical protein NPD2_209 [Clostridium botulinum]MCS4446204.1 hypothetical protein [Clostridium botulinum]MCS4456588.1 hypothetical protein [Clostridium botulinum]MCS4461093.1 hypothetical protein [Clostridium botulinum]MCS4513296.1 hypothetical protein [Clostridium botulinum]